MSDLEAARELVAAFGEAGETLKTGAARAVAPRQKGTASQRSIRPLRYIYALTLAYRRGKKNELLAPASLCETAQALWWASHRAFERWQRLVSPTYLQRAIDDYESSGLALEIHRRNCESCYWPDLWRDRAAGARLRARPGGRRRPRAGAADPAGLLRSSPGSARGPQDPELVRYAVERLEGAVVAVRAFDPAAGRQAAGPRRPGGVRSARHRP